MTDTKFLVLLGTKIKKRRLKKGISQTELAHRCGFEKASMSRIESGKSNVTVLTLKKISEALSAGMTNFF